MSQQQTSKKELLIFLFILYVLIVLVLYSIEPAKRFFFNSVWSYSETRDKVFTELGLFETSTSDADGNGGELEFVCETRVKGQKNLYMRWPKSEAAKRWPVTLFVLTDDDAPKEFTFQLYEPDVSYKRPGKTWPDEADGLYLINKEARKFYSMIEGKRYVKLKSATATNRFDLLGLDVEYKKLVEQCPSEKVKPKK